MQWKNSLKKKNKFFSYFLFSKKKFFFKKKNLLNEVKRCRPGGEAKPKPKTPSFLPFNFKNEKDKAPLHHLYNSQRAVELGLLNPHPFALLLTRCCRFLNTYFAFQQWKFFVLLCFLTIPYSLTPLSHKHATILTHPNSNSELPQTQPTFPLAPHS